VVQVREHRELVRGHLTGGLESHAARDALAGEAQVVGEREALIFLVCH
jgi:hypothetical protein